MRGNKLNYRLTQAKDRVKEVSKLYGDKWAVKRLMKLDQNSIRQNQ